MVGRLFATSSRRGGVWALLAAIAAAIAAVLAMNAATPVTADAAPNRALFCAPYAYVPVVSAPYAYARGETGCDGGSSYYFTLKLINRAGNQLGNEFSGGPLSYSAYFETAWIVCTGAYVRSFLYINDSGTGRSDTSGENPYCTY